MARRSGQPGGRGSATATDADRVVGAAYRIVSMEGDAALTIRRLAAELGVAVTAIYWHVGDKQAVLAAVADRVVGTLATVRARGGDPVRRVVSVGRAVRRKLLGEAALVGVVHAQGRTPELFEPVRRVLLRELLAAGLGDDDATLALHVVLHHVIGLVLLEIQVARAPVPRTGEPDEPAPGDLFDHSLEALVRGLLLET